MSVGGKKRLPGAEKFAMEVCFHFFNKENNEGPCRVQSISPLGGYRGVGLGHFQTSHRNCSKKGGKHVHVNAMKVGIMNATHIISVTTKPRGKETPSLKKKALLLSSGLTKNPKTCLEIPQEKQEDVRERLTSYVLRLTSIRRTPKVGLRLSWERQSLDRNKKNCWRWMANN